MFQAKCGPPRDCCTDFCFFGALECGDLVLRFASAASSSTLALAVFNFYHRQIVESPATDYNRVSPPPRITTHNALYQNRLVCHFRDTSSQQRVIICCNSLQASVREVLRSLGAAGLYRTSYDLPMTCRLSLSGGMYHPMDC